MVTRHLERAETARQQGRARRAWAILGRAVESAPPDDARAVIAWAEALPADPSEPSAVWSARAERVRDAVDTFLEASPRHGEAPRLGRLRAWAAALAGDHLAAIERASGAAGLQDRASADLLRDLATLAVIRRDLDAARRALLAALRAYPQGNGVLGDLGAVELALGRPNRAVERFGRILGRHPEDLDVRRDLAGALVAAGRAEAAVALLTRAIPRYGDEAPELHLDLAHAALEASDATVAERAARAAIEHLAEDDGRGHTALGAAFAAQRRRGDAEAAFAEALRRDPDDLRARHGLAALRSPEPRPAPAMGRLLGRP